MANPENNILEYDPKLNPALEFRAQDGKVLGLLWVDTGGTLRFSGEIEPCAVLFLEFLNEYGVLVGGKQPNYDDITIPKSLLVADGSPGGPETL